MKIQNVANAVIINGAGKVLLTQRFDLENPRIHMKWQVPGGAIEKGEEALDACIREAYEETGLKVKILSQKPFIVKQKYEDIQFNLNVYLATPVSGTISSTSDPETNDVKWYEYDEMKHLKLLDNTITMVEHCLNLWKKH